MFLLKKKSFILICFTLLSNFLFSQDSVYQKGIASYYSDAFNGRYTSSGEKYNNKFYTAAHATLPLHTIVKVTNLKNNKSVIVKINDRCFYSKTRIIDLSKAAAQQLDIIAAGLANINLTILDSGDLNIIKDIDSALLLPKAGDSIKKTGNLYFKDLIKKYGKVNPAIELLAINYYRMLITNNIAASSYFLKNEFYMRRMICMVFPAVNVFGLRA